MKAWQINEFEIWAAPTLEDAISASMAKHGVERDDAFDAAYGYEVSASTPVHDEEDEKFNTTIGALLAEVNGVVAQLV